MTPIHLSNQIYKGANHREALYDLQIPSNYNGELIIFSHGFMGFKDWGCWELVQSFFCDKGYAFLRYNVSHNGTTIKHPVDFTDLEAFGNNSYSYELEDLKAILEIVEERFDPQPVVNLIGHSRGGGIALLFSHDDSVSRIISWAGISSIQERFPKGEELEKWKNTGVRSIHNSRTGQDLPLYYMQFEDFLNHRKRLNIEYYCRTSSKPTLVIHGDQDSSVFIKEGEELANWLQTELVVIPGAQHTFGAAHPCNSETLPADLKFVCEQTLKFISKPIDMERNQNVSAIVELIKLAKSDNKLRQEEFDFIHRLAQMMGVSTDEFKDLFERYIAFTPPPLEFDRILQFQRLLLLMHVDGETAHTEIDHLREIGIRMGLNPMAIENILDEMQLHSNGMIPPQTLLKIFQVYHN